MTSTQTDVPSADRSPRVWVDGRVSAAPVVSALDHGLTVGDAVFETGKVSDGRVFARTLHHDRMDRSLAALGLPPVDRDRIDRGIDEVCSGIAFGRVRWTVTAGPGPLGSDRGSGEPTYLAAAVALEPPAATCAVAVVPWARNERSALAGVKSTSYAENVVALAAARRLGCDEALLANTAGQLCEGTGSNVFVVLDGIVRTPSLETGPLAGVTRDLVLRWLREDGLEVREEPLPLGVLDEVDEVWITSSTRDVCAVTRLEVASDGVLLTGETLPAPRLRARVLGEGPGPVAVRARQIFTRREQDSPLWGD